jgi:hypothetical protein
MQRSTARALLGSMASDRGFGSLAGAARWVLSSSLEGELEQLRERRTPSAVLWATGDTLLPRWIGERSAELLGASFEAVTWDESWRYKRPPDHDWPIRDPGFFAEWVDRAIAGLRRGRRPKRAV